MRTVNYSCPKKKKKKKERKKKRKVIKANRKKKKGNRDWHDKTIVKTLVMIILIRIIRKSGKWDKIPTHIQSNKFRE